jgi:hypothetical protein
MGAKTCMLIYSKGNPAEILKSQPVLDREATAAFVDKLFSPGKLEPAGDTTLCDTCPPDGEVVAGYFPGLVFVATQEFGIGYPSHLPAKFLDALPGYSVHLHAMHSVVDWFAYASWQDGKLERAMSLSPDTGVQEDIGERLAFEQPYWAGAHPTTDPDEAGDGYPLAFHPLELAEAALLALLGYQIEGMRAPTHLDPVSIQLLRFTRPKPWWRRIW